MRALSPAANRERHIPLVGDRVACPRLGSVDLERCRECPYLVRVGTPGGSGEPDVGFVVCSVAAAGPSDIDW